MWELLKHPIALLGVGIGFGFGALLYFLGSTVDESPEDVQEMLDKTQPLPMMPSFDNEDDAIKWHQTQIQKQEAIKQEKLDRQQLEDKLDNAVLQIEQLTKMIQDMEGKSHEQS